MDWNSQKTFAYDDNGDSWCLTSISNLKNYEGEIAKFLMWLAPYIETDGFLGFTRYEEYDTPTLIYKWESGMIQFFKPQGAPNE